MEADFGGGPSWALAMFGPDCFSKDVIRYAENLAQHASARLDGKTQVGDGERGRGGGAFTPVAAWSGVGRRSNPGRRLIEMKRCGTGC